jgi:hypothetical protein
MGMERSSLLLARASSVPEAGLARLYCMFAQGKIIRFSIAPGDLQSKGLRTAFQMEKKIAPVDSMLKC